MIWEELFSWSHQTIVAHSDNSPKIINGNTLIKQSKFMDIKRNATLLITDKSYYCSIDYCSFIECSSVGAKGNVGCIHFLLTGYGSVSITRTIADSCLSNSEGNFARVQVADFGSIFVMMTSVDKCAPDLLEENYHSIFMYSGSQIVKNINNTRCFANRHAGFSNYVSKSVQVDFCNVVDNYVGVTSVYYIKGNGEVRRVNFIRNQQNVVYEAIPGILGTGIGLNLERVIITDCVFEQNSGALLSVYNTDMTLIGCSFDSDNFAKINGNINNIEPRHRERVTMTLLAGAGKNAEIPYGARRVDTPSGRIVIPLGLLTVLNKNIFFKKLTCILIPKVSLRLIGNIQYMGTKESQHAASNVSGSQKS